MIVLSEFAFRISKLFSQLEIAFHRGISRLRISERVVPGHDVVTAIEVVIRRKVALNNTVNLNRTMEINIKRIMERNMTHFFA